MTAELRLQAARFAVGLLGRLDADDIKATVESLVDAGVWDESFLPAIVESHPRLDDVVPAFLVALGHHGVAVPDKNTAIWQLIEHHLRHVVAVPGEALVRFGHFMDGVYWHCHTEMTATKFVGDSHRIEKLLSLYWTAGDLRDQQHPTVNGVHGQQAWAELDHLVFVEATRWLSEFERASPPPSTNAVPVQDRADRTK